MMLERRRGMSKAGWVGKLLGVVLLVHTTTVTGLRKGNIRVEHNEDETIESSFQLALRSMGLEGVVYVPFNASSSTPVSA